MCQGWLMGKGGAGEKVCPLVKEDCSKGASSPGAFCGLTTILKDIKIHKLPFSMERKLEGRTCPGLQRSVGGSPGPNGAWGGSCSTPGRGPSAQNPLLSSHPSLNSRRRASGWGGGEPLGLGMLFLAFLRICSVTLGKSFLSGPTSYW